jgi:hypothetical protein
MVVIRKAKATEVSYTNGVTTVSEVPDCIEAGEKPQPG